MKTLNRNKQSFYYSNFVSKSKILDGNGLSTGEFTNTYTSPVQFFANISASRGTADLEQFGIDTNYTKTIVTDDLSLVIDENSILWVGITPDSSGESGTVKHNYVIAGIAKSLNSITLAIREVKTK